MPVTLGLLTALGALVGGGATAGTSIYEATKGAPSMTPTPSTMSPSTPAAATGPTPPQLAALSQGQANYTTQTGNSLAPGALEALKEQLGIQG